MSRSLEVADIFRDQGAAWREARAGHLSLGQLKVMSAIERLQKLRATTDRLQLLPQPALSQVPGHSGTALVGGTPTRSIASGVLPSGFYFASTYQ
jgi:hypothetical protein